MAGDLKRVASKAGTMNGSKDMRGSRVLWLLCLVDDGRYSAAPRRQRRRRTTSCFNASSSELRSWTLPKRALRAWGVPRSEKHGRTSAIVARDGVGI